MIDPKELSIGNYIIGHNGELIRAERIDYHEYEINEWSNIYTTQPIPLTDAVLEACGFEKDYPIYKVPHESLSHIEKNGYKQTKDYGKWLWFNKYGDMEASIGASFQYLHQLQNLYYALTGKDLEIDETKLEAAIAKADIV